MALFNFPYVCHGETPLPLQDLLLYVQLALKEAGHDVYISRYVEGGAINIFIEGFGDSTTQLLRRYAKMGVKIIIIASEIVTNGTFNDFRTIDDGAGWYGRHAEWDRRYQNFLQVAEASKMVWCLAPEQAEGYASITSPDWVRLLPIGYVPGYRTVEQRPDSLKDIDFAFSGTLTKHREKTFADLQRRGFHVQLIKQALPTYIRKNIISRVKICLGLKQFTEWKYSSLTRNYYHLMNGAFLLSESCEIASPVDAYIETAEEANFIDACVQTIARQDLSKMAAEKLERYRQDNPIKTSFAAFLEECLSP